jgi:hypothetical protein
MLLDESLSWGCLNLGVCMKQENEIITWGALFANFDTVVISRMVFIKFINIFVYTTVGYLVI